MNRAARLLCETCSSTVAAPLFCMPPSGAATYALSAAMSAPVIMIAKSAASQSMSCDKFFKRCLEMCVRWKQNSSNARSETELKWLGSVRAGRWQCVLVSGLMLTRWKPLCAPICSMARRLERSRAMASAGFTGKLLILPRRPAPCKPHSHIAVRVSVRSGHRKQSCHSHTAIAHTPQKLTVGHRAGV